MGTSSWPNHLLSLAEWDALPADPSHRFELIDGILHVVPRPALRHQRAMVRLAAHLDAALPGSLTALADVEFVVSTVHPATVRVPSVVVVATAATERAKPRLEAADVLLAVEITSPGRRRTDRVMKLAEYADAGIAGYWLVNLNPPAELTAYTLVDGKYEIAAHGQGALTLLSPFEIRIDLDELVARH